MMETTRQTAVAIVNLFDWKNDDEGLVICDPLTLIELIDTALRQREEEVRTEERGRMATVNLFYWKGNTEGLTTELPPATTSTREGE